MNKFYKGLSHDLSNKLGAIPSPRKESSL